MKIHQNRRPEATTTTITVPRLDGKATGQASAIPPPIRRRQPRFEKTKIEPGRWQIGRILAQKFFGDGLAQLSARTIAQYTVGKILEATLAPQNRIAINITCYVTGSINTAFFSGMMVRAAYKYDTLQYNDFDFRLGMAAAATQCALSVGSMAAVSVPFVPNHVAAGLTVWQAKTATAQIGRLLRATFQRGLKTFDNRCASKLTASLKGEPVADEALAKAQVRFNQALYAISAMLLAGTAPLVVPQPNATFVMKVVKAALAEAQQLYAEETGAAANATATPQPESEVDDPEEPDEADFDGPAPEPQPDMAADDAEATLIAAFAAFDRQFSFRADGLPYWGALLEAVDGITPDLANYFFLHCFEQNYTGFLRTCGIECDEMKLQWEKDVRPFSFGWDNVPKIIDNWMARNHMGAPVDVVFMTSTFLRHFLEMSPDEITGTNWAEAVLLAGACCLAIGLFPTSDGRKNIRDDGNIDANQLGLRATEEGQADKEKTVESKKEARHPEESIVERSDEDAKSESVIVENGEPPAAESGPDLPNSAPPDTTDTDGY